MRKASGNITGVKKKCDVIFSRIIRSEGRCRHCGSPYNLQCAHVLSRRFSHTRTFERNAVPLCAKCHHYFTDHPVSFGVWVTTSVMSREAYTELVARSQWTGKVDWESELVRLREIEARMKASA